ncbi:MULTISPECIES: CPCC family cysteine-rich protein [Exiguobacterium]|uniref:CPCC family cysteine-rich protein n=1 Tax=Exiguobacterium TaxID=33986 RepID=UPI001BECE578|nr:MULTISPECIES: CPCC family cysteine-rich protein [Exiguobacterium]MCT4776691.1 CPCC family cysteine-rich protein [Exiguobacterium aquaticum]MCT4788702.1 CPCC family cysteine-rich protein [Exiguobacterium mexicanum]
MTYTCPCCGYQTLNEEPPGTYDICGICFWEDDGVQFRDPDYEGGANTVSLRQAQQNYIRFGVSELLFSDSVRTPTEHDIKDSKWRPLTNT